MNKKIGKAVLEAAWLLVMVSLIYLGFYAGIQGAQNVVLFAVWVLAPIFIGPLLFISHKDFKKQLSENPHIDQPVAKAINRCVYFWLLGTLAWFGFWATSTVLSVSMLASYYLDSVVIKDRKVT